MTPGFSCSTGTFWPGSTSAQGRQEFIILLRNVPGLSTWLLPAWRTCEHQSMLILIAFFCQQCCKARMLPVLRMKIWILRLSPHCNSLLLLPQGLTLHACTSPSVRKNLSISPLSESSRVGSQGCSFHQAQRKHWPCWWTVNSGYLQWANRAKSFDTPTVLKSQVIAFIRSQKIQRQSSVLTRHLCSSCSQIRVTHHYYSHFFHTEIHTHHIPHGTE